MESFALEQITSEEGPLKGLKIKNSSSIGGGCIHNAWKLELSNGETVFAKTTTKEKLSMLKFEAIGLKTLRKYGNNEFLVIPKPIGVFCLENFSLLLLPWLDLCGGNQINLGKGLALMHKTSADNNLGKYGWENNGFIGLGEQVGGWRTSWGKCFIELRLIPQIKMAEKWGLKMTDYNNIFPKLIDFIEEHRPLPSIVHGDLWSGNASVNKQKKGLLFDPATWWADREVDLAMTRLFGGFSQDFYAGYESIWPLSSKSSTRIEIYNLYHLLNHANIFGGTYMGQSKTVLEKLKSSIGN